MVQKEFWVKVEKVALLLREKKEEKESRRQMNEDLNDIMTQTACFSQNLFQAIFKI